ncbi:MAG: hypothetical protein CMQ49_05130 [Gammaproteobacteria bacterium]|nr:hypothetical protein [Gammaproteobacteria bacterium]
MAKQQQESHTDFELIQIRAWRITLLHQRNRTVAQDPKIGALQHEIGAIRSVLPQILHRVEIPRCQTEDPRRFRARHPADSKPG